MRQRCWRGRRGRHDCTGDARVVQRTRSYQLRIRPCASDVLAPMSFEERQHQWLRRQDCNEVQQDFSYDEGGRSLQEVLIGVLVARRDSGYRIRLLASMTLHLVKKAKHVKSYAESCKLRFTSKW